MTNKQAQELLIQNGQLVADTLRHLADNEIDSDYFAITSTSENGTETEHELVITEYARQAAGTVDELVKALEAKDKRIAELEDLLFSEIRLWTQRYDAANGRREAAEKRVAELEASHSKLRESMAAIHNTIRLDGARTSLAVILNAAKRAHDESAAATGIRINGEG